MGLFGKKSGSEKRAQYRVEVGAEAPLHVSIVAGDRLVAAELVDVSSRGCQVKVPVADGRAWKDKDTLDLRFTSPGTGRAVVAVGIIRNLERGESQTAAGMEFEDVEAIYGQLDTRLWAFFNRRKGFRVTPLLGPGKRVPVKLDLGSEQRTEYLNDLSVLGLALRVSKAEGLMVRGDVPCHAEMELPGGERPFRLGLRVVHHTETPASLRIGFKVDPEATEDHEEQHEALIRYVLEAQRTLLQRDRG